MSDITLFIIVSTAPDQQRHHGSDIRPLQVHSGACTRSIRGNGAETSLDPAATWWVKLQTYSSELFQAESALRVVGSGASGTRLIRMSALTRFHSLCVRIMLKRNRVVRTADWFRPANLA